MLPLDLLRSMAVMVVLVSVKSVPIDAASSLSQPLVESVDHSWAGISSYYLYTCNSTVRTEALNAVKYVSFTVRVNDGLRPDMLYVVCYMLC